MSSLLIAKRYAAALLRLAKNEEEIKKQDRLEAAAASLFLIEATQGGCFLVLAMPKSLKRTAPLFSAKVLWGRSGF